MIISYLGHSCFKLRGTKTIVVTDPYDREVFSKAMPRTKADIVTISHFHHDHCAVDRVAGSPFVINGPGEYEIKGISIFGTSSFHDKVQGAKRGKNTIYVYNIDDLRLSHLGDLGCKLTEKQIEQVSGIDILMIPVGGVYTINAKEAVAVIEQLEPKIIIPMHYKTKDLSFELKPIDEFLEEMGKKEIEPVKDLKITKATLPEEIEVVWLKK